MPKGGPRGGQRFRDEWQPVMGLLWDELDKNNWREVVVTGPAQASKSFGSLVIPTLRDIVELEYSPILGVPEADMFSDKWDRDFKPVLEESEELSWLLPSIGSGKRGGRVRDRVTFDNGTDLKVMSRGGQATNKAGYTTPRLRITEAAGFSDASTSGRDEEADSYRQLLSRLGAFDLLDPRRLVLVEGTGTVREHLPWRLRGEDDDEKLISTRSRLVSPCPHCEKYISPEREHLVGWQTAETIVQAYEQAVFLCPECSEPISDEQRRASMQHVLIVHWGQEVTVSGEVVGPVPDVFRLWFRYSAWHNCLINVGTIAAAEWEAAQNEEGTEDAENAERDMCQKKWAIPFKSKLANQDPLDAKKIRKRTNIWKRNLLPHDTTAVTVGVDIGDWTGWPFVTGHRENGERHVPSYGAFAVKNNKSDDLESRIVAALHEYADKTIEQGFPQEGVDGLYVPDKVWIDGQYQTAAVAKFIRERGGIKQKRYWLARGRGTSKKNGSYKTPAKVGGKIVMIGKHWHGQINYQYRIIEIWFDADYWKKDLDSRFRAKIGRKGAISFFQAEEKDEHSRVSRHICNEQFKRKWVPGEGLIEKWVKTGDNHLKDSGAMSLAAGDMAGVDLTAIVEHLGKPTGANQADAQDSQSNWYEAMLCK